MTKELRCRDVGFECDAVVTAENEEDVLRQVAEHARTVHGLSAEELNDPVLLERVRSQIHEGSEPR